MRGQRKAILGFLTGFVVLVAVAALENAATHASLESAARVEHTHRVLSAIDDVDELLFRVEAGKRAYTVTGDESYLAGHPTWNTQFTALVDRLEALVADNADQARRLDELAPALAKRVAWLDGGIAARRARGFDLAEETENIRVGTATSVEIRQLLDALRAEERRLLAAREAVNERDATRGRIVVFAGMGIAMLIFGVTFAFLRRENRRRLELERAARDGEQRLSTMLNSIGDGVISTDEHARVTRMNPVAQALTGWSDEQARGKPFREVFNLVNEKTRGPAPDPVQQALERRGIVALENHTGLIARDGTERSIADSAAPIWDKDGRLTGVVVVFRDAEAERVHARRIAEANTFLDSIVENIPNMIFVKDATDLRFVRFNAAGEKLLATERSALIGKTDRDLFPEEQATVFQAKDREVLERDAMLDIAEEPLETPHGTRWLHTKKIPIKDADGHPLFLLGISEDITERKQIDDRQRQLNEELEQRVQQRTADLTASNAQLQREIAERIRTAEALERSENQLRQAQKIEAIGRLAGGIAHDFNNLLSVILSYSEMLVADLSDDDPRRGDLEEIHRAGERAAALTRQLLAFSRQQVLTPQILDLNTIVRGMEKLLRRVIGEDIELRFVPAEIDKVKVDPGQMEQVIMNLVVNARDAMPRGGRISIETGIIDLDETYATEHAEIVPGRHVMLAISDTGHGMDKATLGRIFEPFFTTKEKGKGTGLGLSTVFGIVKQSGGSLYVYSEPGAGTAFKIFLPTAEGDVAATQTRAATRPRGSETILLVEDEDPVRALVRNLLTRYGYQVLEAVNGEDALEKCEQFSGTIHLVVTDVVMPKMSGRELVEKLATIRPTTKVLFMSGYTDDTMVHHGVVDQGLAFLQKPVTPDVLLRKVREVLGQVPRSAG